MKKYRVIVRDYNNHYNQPSDLYLIALDRYYMSPIIYLDLECDWDKAITEFEEKCGRYYSRFIYPNLEFVPMDDG